MQFHQEREKILVIDFGSQVTKLIGRNIRELGVYSEIITPKELLKIKEFKLIKGIIFSGGPSSVNSKNHQTISRKIFDKNIKLFSVGIIHLNTIPIYTTHYWRVPTAFNDS